MHKTTQPTVSVLKLCYKFFVLRRIHFDLGCNRMRADIALRSAASAASAGLRRARLMTLDCSELLKILDPRSAFVTCDLIAQRLLITDVIIHFVVRHNLNFSSSSSPDPLSDLTSVRTFNDLPKWSVSHFVLSFLIFLHLHFLFAGSYDTLGFYSPPPPAPW